MDEEIEKRHSQSLRKILSTFGDLCDSDWEIFIQNFHFKHIKKGERILSPGDRADFSFFIGKGLVKRYFLCDDGREYIISFDAEGRMVSDYVSHLEGIPALIFIEALEDCEVLMSSYGFKKEIEKKSGTWERNGRIVAEKRYIEKCKREYNLLHYGAEDRLRIFREEQPGIFERLSRKDLASYIGVTPQSLSRLMKP